MAKQSQPAKQNKSLLKLIERYYADLADLARQHVMFEMGTRHAFHRLMADAGKPHGVSATFPTIRCHLLQNGRGGVAV